VIHLIQFHYSTDNLGYLLFSGTAALAVDPGDPDPVMGILRKKNLQLKMIVNTHGHYDHTSGNSRLSSLTGAEILKPGGNELSGILAEPISVIATPGHTEDSICLHFDHRLLTGDTLFIANIGNCPPSRLKIFRHSLSRILSLDDETVVYPGHDYTERSLQRAATIEKDNADLKEFIAAYHSPPVASTIGIEKRINPYLRTDSPEVITYLKENNKATTNAFQRFKSFIEL